MADGTAPRPTGWKIWFGAAKGVFLELNNNNLGLISAGIAFYAMLALFPATAAIIALWGFFSDPAVVSQQMQMLAPFVPAEAYVIIDDQVQALVSANTSTLGWATLVSLMAALWSARAGVAALIRGLNAIYRERNRMGLRHLATAFGVTLLLIAVALVALCCVIVIPVVLAFLPFQTFMTSLIDVLRWVIAIAVVIMAIGVLYRFGPNRRHARPGWLTPGAICAVIIWALISWGFSYYLTNFGSYNEVYGALGAVIALLMWLYLSAFSVLLGASLNAELELRTRKDSTVGEDRPMGERGAHVADTLVAE